MTSSASSSASSSLETDAAVQQTVQTSENNALKIAKRNLTYLFNPQDKANAPARLRTRALFKSLHYISIFLFWRLVRYGKYVAVGALVTAVGATAYGSVISGAAFFIAPPTIGASIGIGLLWVVGRWGFRRALKRTQYARQREIATGQPYGDPIPEPKMAMNSFA